MDQKIRGDSRDQQKPYNNNNTHSVLGYPSPITNTTPEASAVTTKMSIWVNKTRRQQNKQKTDFNFLIYFFFFFSDTFCYVLNLERPFPRQAITELVTNSFSDLRKQEVTFIVEICPSVVP